MTYSGPSGHIKQCVFFNRGQVAIDKHCVCREVKRSLQGPKVTKQDLERISNILWVLIAIIIIGSLL